MQKIVSTHYILKRIFHSIVSKIQTSYEELSDWCKKRECPGNLPPTKNPWTNGVNPWTSGRRTKSLHSWQVCEYANKGLGIMKFKHSRLAPDNIPVKWSIYTLSWESLYVARYLKYYK